MTAATVLVDTSVWISYFRHGNPQLQTLMSHNLVLMHEMVVGEVACWTPPKPRDEVLYSLKTMRSCIFAQTEEVLSLIEKHQFYGRGCGWVDMNLLASTLLTPQTKLWTLDARLQTMAEQMGVSYLAAWH